MFLAWLLLITLVAGCSAPQHCTPPASRRFDFTKDTFSFANELVWEYGYDKDGQWSGHPRDPKPDYTLHCFVLARSAAQFFGNARFDLDLPVADEATYRRLIHQVVSSSLKAEKTNRPKIVIPGYANLRTFSQAWEQLLKAECGSFWHSYFQRGHWRMIFPFSRGHQTATADELLRLVANNRIAVVHVVCFPSLAINHAVVVFDAQPAEKGTLLLTYDPNDPEKPLPMTYDSTTRTFQLASTLYFPGGPVDVYQVYHRWNY